MIKAVFNTQQIVAQLAAKVEAIELAIIAILQRRGEQFVTECRNEDTYKDQTGNLRASIGYFIFKGSELIFSSGNEIAAEVCNEVDKRPGVYYLIGVAGMNYAAAVEAKGYNVISNQAIKIIPLIEGDLKQLQSKFSK